MSVESPAVEQNTPFTVELTAAVVSAYVGNNSVAAADIPKLIGQVYDAISRLNAAPEVKQTIEIKPAVSVRKSITPDFLVCLEDGKKFKSLRRHLSALGMTPQQYRDKWNLPADYPMVAPNYSATRSELAKASGLGKNVALKSRAAGALKPKPSRQSKAVSGTVAVLTL